MAKDEFTIAIGFTIDLGGRQIAIEPQDVSKIDDGTFTIDLPEDETRTIGSLAQFYADVDRLADDNLPDFPSERVPEPLLEAAEAKVTLRRFLLRVESRKFKQVEIDASAAAEWTVPNTQIKVGNPRVVLTFTAS
jgi:hypothetical protein